MKTEEQLWSVLIQAARARREDGPVSEEDVWAAAIERAKRGAVSATDRHDDDQEEESATEEAQWQAAIRRAKSGRA